MFSFVEPGFFVPTFAVTFMIAGNAAQKRAALMSWENCEAILTFCFLGGVPGSAHIVFGWSFTFPKNAMWAEGGITSSGFARTAVGGPGLILFLRICGFW